MEPHQHNLEFHRKSKKVNKKDIRIVESERGSKTIFLPGYLDHGLYVPPLEEFKNKVLKQLKRNYRLSNLYWMYLRHCGLLHPTHPSRSIETGSEVLGISSPREYRCNHHQKRAEQAVRRMWHSRDVEMCIRDPTKHPLPSIIQFKRKFPAEYKFIREHDGMYDFLENLHPGLYNAINQRTVPSNLHSGLKKLGKELREAVHSGLPLSSTYLSRSDDSKERRWYRQISFLMKNYPDSKRRLQFEEVVSRLTGISQADVHAIPVGARECGELAEAFVRCYLVWASKESFDPLNLNLNHLPNTEERALKFDREEIKFKFEHNKKGYAYADGRLGDTALEVKVESKKLRGRVLEDCLQRYGNGNHWNDGEKMNGAILFLYQEPKFFVKAISHLEKADIRVIEFHDFQGSFAALMDRVLKRNTELLEYTEPKINLPAGICTMPAVLSEVFAYSNALGIKIKIINKK